MSETDPGSERAERGPVGFPPPFVYLAGLGVGVVLEFIKPTSGPSSWLRWGGAIVSFAIGLYLDGKATALFVKHKTPMPPWQPSRVLVTEGPYRFTRNPMYLGMAFHYVALSLAFGLSWALLLLPLVVIVIDRAVIAREEPYLESLYGDKYREYKARTRRWF